jgi:hypothetical protein
VACEPELTRNGFGVEPEKLIPRVLNENSGIGRISEGRQGEI